MEKLLYEHLGACGAKPVAYKHVVNGLLGLFGCFRDHDALARGKSVGLYDNRQPKLRERRFCSLGRGERLRLSRGNACGVHHLLGKTLGALHPRAGRDRAEAGNTCVSKSVGKARDKRSLGTRHYEVRLLGLRPRRDPRDVVGLERHAFRKRGNAGVSWSAVDFIWGGVVGETPDNCVFAAAGTNYEDFHMPISL